MFGAVERYRRERVSFETAVGNQPGCGPRRAARWSMFSPANVT